MHRVFSIFLGSLLALPGLTAPASAKTPAPKGRLAQGLGERSLILDNLQQLVHPGAGKLTAHARTELRRAIVKARDDDPKKPELFIRLAEHFRHRALSSRRRAASSTGAVRQRHEKAWKRSMRASMKLYLQVIRNSKYRSYQRMDEALYFATYLMTSVGRMHEARKFFRLLVKNHPTSQWLPWAYASFGEYHFGRDDFEKAQKIFRESSRHYPRSPAGIYGLYMEAWCWWRLAYPRKALTTFVKTIKAAAVTTGPAWDALRSGARMGAVVCYADMAAAQQAKRFFERIGGKQTRALLGRLAALYEQKGRAAQAAEVRRQLSAW